MNRSQGKTKDAAGSNRSCKAGQVSVEDAEKCGRDVESLSELPPTWLSLVFTMLWLNANVTGQVMLRIYSIKI
jgi:hypothetical protein